jgi:hypothetical protein
MQQAAVNREAAVYSMLASAIISLQTAQCPYWGLLVLRYNYFPIPMVASMRILIFQSLRHRSNHAIVGELSEATKCMGNFDRLTMHSTSFAF